MAFKNQSLDPEYRPEARPMTALGGLLAGRAAGILVNREETARHPVRLWANRPGMNRLEMISLAGLVTLTVGGLAGAGIASWLGPESFSGWIVALLLMAPAFFAGAHVLIFSSAAIAWLVRMVGIRVDLPPGHFCGRIFLSLLTGVCGLVCLATESGGAKVIATVWLSVAGLNGAAWVIGRGRSLLRELSRVARE